MNLSGLTALTSLNGALTTTDPLGIVLSGVNFNISGPIATSNGGPLAITNSGSLVFSPSLVMSLEGPFSQSGSGAVSGGGAWTTNNQNVSFQAPFTLTGNLVMNPGDGAVTFTDNVRGPFDLTIHAGMGAVSFLQTIGDITPLDSLTVTSTGPINLDDVGSTSAGISRQLSLTTAGDISFMGNNYSAGSQFYSSGGNSNVNTGSLVTFNSLSGPIAFANGTVHLADGSDILVNTNNSDFSYEEITGTSLENVTINTGTGTAFMNTISVPGSINNVIVNAGNIYFAGSIEAVNTDFESLGEIQNSVGPVAINSVNTAIFNALDGDVGTLTNPILVNTSNRIFAGAIQLADFEGSSGDNTVHPIPTNIPCMLIWNGAYVLNCEDVPIIIPPIAVPGVESSYFDLASDYYFTFTFLSDCYFWKDPLLYWRGPYAFCLALPTVRAYTLPPVACGIPAQVVPVGAMRAAEYRRAKRVEWRRPSKCCERDNRTRVKPFPWKKVEVQVPKQTLKLSSLKIEPIELVEALPEVVVDVECEMKVAHEPIVKYEEVVVEAEPVIVEAEPEVIEPEPVVAPRKTMISDYEPASPMPQEKLRIQQPSYVGTINESQPLLRNWKTLPSEVTIQPPLQKKVESPKESPKPIQKPKKRLALKKEVGVR
jgi:hypothetical protein